MTFLGVRMNATCKLWISYGLLAMKEVLVLTKLFSVK